MLDRSGPSHGSWIAFRGAVGPFLVAGGIGFEILFSRLSSIKERKIRDWYGLRVAELNVETQRLRNELWKQIQPRELSLDQQRAIGSALRNFSGQKVTVFSYSWDPEGRGFSEQIVAALRFANLNVVDRSGESLSSLPAERGVVVLGWLTGDLARSIGDALRSLGNVGEVAVVQGSSNSQDPVLNIFVGPKPPVVLQR